MTAVVHYYIVHYILLTGTSLIKARNFLLGGGTAAAICWPQQTVEGFSHSYNYVKEPVVDLWTQYCKSIVIAKDS